MSTQTVRPTSEQIVQAKQAIDEHIRSIGGNPEHRDGAFPYYLFHEPGEPVLGTVMLFHGFSARPHQCWRLADYLFRNGFNVYQPSLAGHTLVNPAKNWPQVDLKPEIAIPLKEKAQQDPVMQTYLANLSSNPAGFTPLQQAAVVARLITLEPRLLEIIQAIESSDESTFDTYYISSHLNYLSDAKARLAEIDSLPGPVYTVGLSVGGAVALALAAARPDRVQRTVAYAPLLKIYAERRQYVNLAGPLDIKEIGWDPDLQFPVGALTAADRFGSSVVLSAKSIGALQQVPTFLVLTENEDAADVPTSQDFFDKIGGDRNRHRSYLYSRNDMVPHPMVDPTEVSQNMSNRFWQSLYQETYRFLTEGEVDRQNMGNLEQDPNLPQVPPLG